MSPWDVLYLITAWTFIVSFNFTYAIITMDPKEVAALRLLEALD